MKTQFFRLLSALIKVHPIPLVIFETTRSGFIQILHHCSVSWKITLLHLFQLKPYILWTKRAHQSKTFRLSTAQVKSQNCTLTGSFYWKHIKFQLKKYRGVMSHDTDKWCEIWRKTDLLFQKWEEFGEFWLEHLKV